MVSSRWFAFALEAGLVAAVSFMAVSAGLSIIGDVERYSVPSVSVYVAAVVGYLFWVRSFARHWTGGVGGRIRTQCCHSRVSRYGPVIRCVTCRSWEPDVYDSESNIVGVLKR